VLAESSDDALRWRIANTILERLGDANPSVRVSATRAFGRVYTPPANPIAQGLMRAASSDPEAERARRGARNARRLEGEERVRGLRTRAVRAALQLGHHGRRARLVAAAEGERALPWLEERLALDSPHDQLAASLMPAFALIRARNRSTVVRRCALDEALDDTARDTACARSRRSPAPHRHQPRAGRAARRTRDYRCRAG
jgi:hypothetical protein